MFIIFPKECLSITTAVIKHHDQKATYERSVLLVYGRCLETLALGVTWDWEQEVEGPHLSCKQEAESELEVGPVEVGHSCELQTDTDRHMHAPWDEFSPVRP